MVIPTQTEARGFWKNMANWFGTSFGATVGHRVGAAVGDGAVHHGSEMIPEWLKKPLLIAGVVGIAAYIIYANQEESSDQQNTNKTRSARSWHVKKNIHKKR